MMEYLTYILSILIAIIGFFLLRLISEHDSTKKKIEQLWTKNEVLNKTFELKHESLGDQMEKLSHSMEKLTSKIDILTDSVIELKHR
jgi:hypothetical protein